MLAVAHPFPRETRFALQTLGHIWQAAAEQWRQCSREHRVDLDGGLPIALQSSWMAQADAVADKRLGKATKAAGPDGACKAPGQGAQSAQHGSGRTVAIVRNPGGGKASGPGAASTALQPGSSRNEAAQKPARPAAPTHQQEVKRNQGRGRNPRQSAAREAPPHERVSITHCASGTRPLYTAIT